MIGWTLGRYFFMRYVKITGWFLLGIFTLALLMDFTENAGRISNLPGYTASRALIMSALRIPFIMQQLFPFIALFGAMATLISLNRKFELVVARSIGVSAWQFIFPACLGAFLFGVLAVIIVNPLAAWGTTQAENMLSDLKGTPKTSSTDIDRIPWLTQKTDDGTTTIGAKSVINRGHTLIDARFVQFNPDNTIMHWLNAERAELKDNYWQLINVTQYKAGQEPQHFDVIDINTNLRPEFVEEKLADPASIPFYELPHKISVARSFGYSANEFNMQLQSLVATPFLMVAMTLIAATVSLKFVRFGQSGALILGGIIAGFVLYVISVLVQAFGNAGYVPAIIAAWVPVLIALFFGISFLLHKEDG